MYDHSFVISKWVFRWGVKRSIRNSVTLETKISINLFNFERVVNRLSAWKLFLVSVSVLVQTKPKFRNFGLNIGCGRSLVVNIVLVGGPQMSWLSQKQTKRLEKLHVKSVLVNSLNLEILIMSLMSQKQTKRKFVYKMSKISNRLGVWWIHFS
jgi:uncharacterized membrane protein